MNGASMSLLLRRRKVLAALQVSSYSYTEKQPFLKVKSRSIGDMRFAESLESLGDQKDTCYILLCFVEEMASYSPSLRQRVRTIIASQTCLLIEAHFSRLPAYFSTPCVQLITALEESLKIITEGSVSIEDRFRLHRENSRRVKKAVSAAGLHMVPVDIEAAANGMTVSSFHVIILDPNSICLRLYMLQKVLKLLTLCQRWVLAK